MSSTPQLDHVTLIKVCLWKFEIIVILTFVCEINPEVYNYIYIINIFHIFHVFNLQHNRQLCSKWAKEVYCERFYNESADPKWNWKCSPSSLKGLRAPGLHSRFVSSLKKDICLQHWEINFTTNTTERKLFYNISCLPRAHLLYKGKFKGKSKLCFKLWRYVHTR